VRRPGATSPPPAPEAAPRREPAELTSAEDGGLFAWHGGGVVLLGERVTSSGGDRWVLARGWSQADRLEHVRRWSFASPERFAGQVRRLVRDATGDLPMSTALARQALVWAGGLTEEPCARRAPSGPLVSGE
jgi:hypothetical protein